MADSRSKGARSPTRSLSSTRHRKLLYDFVELLLAKHEAPESSEVEDNDEPVKSVHADDGLREESHQKLREFARKVKNLDHQLDEFMRAIRKLGSSIGLVSSAGKLQKHMRDILEVFKSNAALIYQEFAEEGDQELPDIMGEASSRENRSFPELLKALSVELRKFLHHLRDIPEFSDSRIFESILSFEEWLVYRVRGLDDFKETLKTTAVMRYINSLMPEMGDHLLKAGDALTTFAKEGVPIIREAQNSSQERLLNMSTVATFFSAVTSTTFQYTSSEEDSTLGQIVRALWVSSLILSIASVINAQLAMHWRAAMYRSPRSDLPMWTLFCLNHTPLIFLIFSVLTFTIGLVGYTYSSSQGKLVTLCATVLTSFTALILLTVVIWEAGERWQASKSNPGDHQPGPGAPRVHLPWEPYEDFKRLNTKMIDETICLTENTYFTLRQSLRRLFTAFPLRRTDPSDDPDSRELEGMELPSAANYTPEKEFPSFKMSLNASQSSLCSQNAEARPPPQRQLSATSKRVSLTVPPFRSPSPITLARSLSFESSDKPHPYLRWRQVVGQMERGQALKGAQVNTPVPSGGRHNLKSLRYSWEIFPEGGVRGAVRDLRFAPNGKWLAASFERGSGIWEVKDGFTWLRSLNVDLGYLSWSPDSSCLVTRHKNGVQLWTSKPKSSRQLFQTDEKYIAFTWLSDNQHFVAATEQSISIIARATGRTEFLHHPSPHALRIRDIASIPGDRGMIIMVGVIQIKDKSRDKEVQERLRSFFGARARGQPKDVRPQKRIAVYDIGQQKIVFQVPVWEEALHVGVSRNGQFALVSYAASPPELWKIEKPQGGKISLKLWHMYLPESKEWNAPAFAGKARFGGHSDQYVVAVAKNGHAYVWDSMSSQLLYTARVTSQESSHPEATGIAWCSGDEERELPLFVCGNKGGGLTIWEGKRSESNQDVPSEPISGASP